jgi:N-acetylglucosaminyldiphosphoundecaprenol N-acetyl-beta-D-mannosaminyltransferase
MINLGKHNVLGIGIDAVDYAFVSAKVVDAARAGVPFSVSALAVHGVMTGVLDNEHQYRLNQLDFVVPDGQPVRWALDWLYGICLPDRVYGPQLMLDVCRQAAEEGLPVFLFGSTDRVLDDLQQNLKQRFPQLRIAGSLSSRFRSVTPEENNKIIHQIRNSGAAMTFVGLGCPRQEVWIYENQQALSMPVLAVGAAYDFHAGRSSQAPSCLQKYGLEWFYRLCHEPVRLWKRYLLLNPLYLYLLFLHRTGYRRFDPDSGVAPTHEVLYG